MKKKYMTPAAVMVEIQNCSIICQSNPYSTMKSGDIFEYAPQSDDDYIEEDGVIR
jgi:hypothetical protein